MLIETADERTAFPQFQWRAGSRYERSPQSNKVMEQSYKGQEEA